MEIYIQAAAKALDKRNRSRLHVWSRNAAFDCLVGIIILRNGGADGWYASAQLGLVMMLGP